MPSVGKGETRSHYVNRAIPAIKSEHPEKSMKQVIGQAEGMFDSKWRGRKKRKKGLGLGGEK